MLKQLSNVFYEFITGKQVNWRSNYSGKKEYKEFMEEARRQAARELKDAGFVGKMGHGIRKIEFKHGEIRQPYGWLVKSDETGKYVPGECLKNKLVVVVGKEWNHESMEMAVHLWKHALLHFSGYVGTTEAQEHKWMLSCPKFSENFKFSRVST